MRHALVLEARHGQRAISVRIVGEHVARGLGPGSDGNRVRLQLTGMIALSCGSGISAQLGDIHPAGVASAQRGAHSARCVWPC